MWPSAMLECKCLYITWLVFCTGYVKIISDDESKRLFSGNCLYCYKEPYNLWKLLPQDWVQQKWGMSSVAWQIGQCDQSVICSLHPVPTWCFQLGRHGDWTTLGKAWKEDDWGCYLGHVVDMILRLSTVSSPIQLCMEVRYHAKLHPCTSHSSKLRLQHYIVVFCE